MTPSTYLKSTECVGPGHPDKVADLIADCILDDCLSCDENAKVGCEVMVKDDIVVLGGEITTDAEPNYQSVVSEALWALGYTNPKLGFAAQTFKLVNLISKQSPEINSAVVGKTAEDLGAGDQGIMWGYATNETPTFMPLGMFLARGMMDALKPLEWDKLFADCKTQVTIEYNEATNEPIRVTHAVVSVMHDASLSLEQVQRLVQDRVYSNLIQGLPEQFSKLFTSSTKWIINHAGTWTIGGPVADCGVTGRKLVVDAYGADCEIGGGATHGKDPSKVDRSAAYFARYVAKNLVAQGFAKKCKIQLGYVIGQREPVSFNVDTMGTGKMSDSAIRQMVKNKVSFAPGAIVAHLKLKNPIYKATAIKGTYGVTPFDGHHTWEKLDLNFGL